MASCVLTPPVKLKDIEPQKFGVFELLLKPGGATGLKAHFGPPPKWLFGRAGGAGRMPRRASGDSL